jgi:hypothetical protein
MVLFEAFPYAREGGLLAGRQREHDVGKRRTPKREG